MSILIPMEASNFIQINVGSKIFKTTTQTLCRSGYFKKALENHDNEKTLYVDADEENFSHVLSYLRNPKYPFPRKYYYELDFYQIDYIMNDLYSEKSTCIAKGCKYPGMQINEFDIVCKWHRGTCLRLYNWRGEGMPRELCGSMCPSDRVFCDKHDCI